MKVAVLLADGFETLEGLTVVDILRRAEVVCSTFGVEKDIITTSHKIEVKADKILNDEIYDYDVVVLPGGMPGSVNLRDNIKVNEVVKDFYNKGKVVAAICAAPIVLGKIGIVEGKNVTCYPGFEDQLVGCNYKNELVVVDGNIITGIGPAAAVPFAFEILKHISPEKVYGIRKGMLFE
jgi:4-methyl-5(b-hydroxyethyl)-thiazole monophosphate biosynthesis